MKLLSVITVLVTLLFPANIFASESSIEVLIKGGEKDGHIKSLDSNLNGLRFGNDSYDGESIGKIIKFVNDHRNDLINSEGSISKLYFQPDFDGDGKNSMARIFISNGTASVRLKQVMYLNHGNNKKEIIPIEGADINVYITGLKEIEGKSAHFHKGVIKEIGSSLINLGRNDVEIMKDFYSQKATGQISLSSQIRLVDFLKQNDFRQIASQIYDKDFLLWTNESLTKLMLEDESLFKKIAKKTKEELKKVILKDGQTGFVFGYRLDNALGLPLSLDFTLDEKGELNLLKINNRIKHVTVNIYRGTSFNLTKTKKRSGLSFEWFNREPEGGLFKQEDYDIALINLSKVVEYFKSTFNWKSFDNRGSDLNATVRFKGSRLLGTAGLRQNAAWAGAPYNQFLFGRGGDTLGDFLNAFDVIGHEFCHAIVAHTANLEGGNEVGALNEHVCDILGVGFEGDLSGKGFDFKIGELVVKNSDKGLRDFLKPELSFSEQPSHMREVNAKFGPYCIPSSQNDECGVHYSNGVLNKAVGLSIQSIGWKRYKDLLFEVITKKLTSKSNFKDYALQTIRTCQQMESLSKDECEDIERNFASVGVAVSVSSGASSDSNDVIDDINSALNDLDRQLCDALKGSCSLFTEGKIYEMCVKCGFQY